MQTIWKGCSVCVLLFSLMMMLPSVTPVHAETTGTKGTTGSGSSIKDKLTSSTDGLEQQVDASTNTAVDTARHIAIFASIVLILYLGYIYLASGFSPDSRMQIKIIWLALIVFLALTFWTEKILGFLLGFFGVNIADIM